MSYNTIRVVVLVVLLVNKPCSSSSLFTGLAASYISNFGSAIPPAPYQMLAFAKSLCTSTANPSVCPIGTGNILSGAGSVTAGTFSGLLTSSTATKLQTSADLVMRKATALAASGDTINFNNNLGNVITALIGVTAWQTSAVASAPGQPWDTANRMFLETFGSSWVTSSISDTEAITWAKFLSQIGTYIDSRVKVTGLPLFALRVVQAFNSYGYWAFPESRRVLTGMVTPGYTSNSVLDMNLVALQKASVFSSLAELGPTLSNTAYDIFVSLYCYGPTTKRCGYPMTFFYSRFSGAFLNALFSLLSLFPLSERAIEVVSQGILRHIKYTELYEVDLVKIFGNHWKDSNGEAADLVASLRSIGTSFATYNPTLVNNALSALLWMFADPDSLLPVPTPVT